VARLIANLQHGFDGSLISYIQRVREAVDVGIKHLSAGPSGSVG
jgi:hypothetical protein